MTYSSDFQWWMLIVILIVPVFLVMLAVLPKRFRDRVRTVLLYPVNSETKLAAALRVLIVVGTVGYLVVRLITFLGR